MTFTKKEMEVLNVLTPANKEFETDDGEYPSPDMFLVISGPEDAVAANWGKTGLDIKIYRGVIASLIKKGAICVDEWTWDLDQIRGRVIEVTAIALTLEGFNQAKSV